MASPDVLKSVSKKLKYYLEIQRLEDGFDLSGPDCPRMDHPPIRARSALQYSGLHDRPLKHYFHHPSVRVALTNLKTADDKNSGQEEEIRKSIVKNMRKYQFNSPSPADEYYGYDSRAGRRLQPEICWGRTPLVRGKMPYISGRCNLRSAPPHTVSRKETKRLLDSTCHLVLAAESGLRSEPESSEDENEEKETKNKHKQSEHNKVNEKKGKDTPSGDRSLSRADQKQESTVVKRNHEKQNMEQQQKQLHSDSDEGHHRQLRRSSPGSRNNHHKGATHNTVAGQHHKATEPHSKQPQKTATKEQSKEQRKTTSSDEKHFGRISIQPNRAKSAKYKSPTRDNHNEKRSSLRNPRNKRLTCSYDQFSTTIEIGTQTSGELLKNYDPSEQVLSEGEEVKYHVDVQTGKCAGAGTKAEIQIVLIGDLGRTEYLPLSEALTPHKIKFKRNQHDLFEVFCPSIGNLQQIKIGHDKKQAEYKWYVESVTVRDFARRTEYRIPCQKWLSGAFGDKETFGEFKVKSSSTFSIDDVDNMDFDAEETYVAMVRTERRISLEAENADTVNEDPIKNSGSLSVEQNSRTTEMKNKDDDTSDDTNSQSDSSSFKSEGELRIPVSQSTPKSPAKSGKPTADKNDDFFDQKKVKENDYSSIIDSIISHTSDSESNSIVPNYASSGNRLSQIDDRDRKSTDQSDSERSTFYLESRFAPAHHKGTPTKVRTPPYGQSPAHNHTMQDAVRFGRYSEVLRLAKDHPELLEQMNDGEYAPIHVAAFYNQLEILKWLTSHVADVDLESKGGHTALQLAAINGHMDCIKVLFDMGAKVNYRNSSGMTALHLATLVGKANSVKWLLGNGADKTVRDSSGSTPLDLAKEFNHSEIAQTISSFATRGKKGASKKETRKVDKNLML